MINNTLNQAVFPHNAVIQKRITRTNYTLVDSLYFSANR